MIIVGFDGKKSNNINDEMKSSQEEEEEPGEREPWGVRKVGSGGGAGCTGGVCIPTELGTFLLSKETPEENIPFFGKML